MSLVERVAAREAARKPVKIQRLERRILVFDLERLPGKCFAWEPRTKYIPPRQWESWPRVLCAAAKWYDSDDMLFAAEWQDGGHEQMVRTIWDWFDKADQVVGFNSVNFDCKHMRTEWLEAGMTPPRPWRDIDLYRDMKRFGYESRALDTVTKRLGLEGKATHYDMAGAFAAAEGDTEAQDKLRVYNEGDVTLTEELLDSLRGWLPNHPFPITANEERVCGQCGSSDLKIRDTNYHAPVRSFALYTCQVCGGHARAGWVSRQASTRGVA